MTSSLAVAILDLAVDDFVGLWEVRWRADALAGPQSTPCTDTALRQEVLDLIASGMVAAYRGVAFAGDEQVLSSEEASAAILDAEAWSPAPPSRIHVRIAATPLGETFYRDHYLS